MTKKYFFASLLIASGIFWGQQLRSASIFDIEYPIPELEGCTDRLSCKTYCEDSAHADACLSFAKKDGLVDETAVKKSEAAKQGGPGGCKGADECRNYCDDPSHENECVEFAVKNGFMSSEEAERIRKPGPGGCRGRACQTYCADPAHEEECFEYAASNGLIPKEEAEKIREFKDKFKKTSKLILITKNTEKQEKEISYVPLWKWLLER